MHILVFNAGSSSLKFSVFDSASEMAEIFKGSFDRFRNGKCNFKFHGGGKVDQGEADCRDIDAAIIAIPAALERFGIGAISAIGHRVVHGGETFSAPVIINDEVVVEIEKLTPLAPLHIPANLEAIREARKTWGGAPQVAIFDTAFHASNPPFVTTYAVPKAWRDAGLRRYGFHGASHQYVAERAAREIGRPLADLQIVSIHLGNGASVCAVNRGRSMDTSMGITPLEGLVMGTRSGDIDPGAFGFLNRQFGLDVEAIEEALYNDSGLKGLTGSSDMRDLEERAAKGDAEAQLAIEIFAYRAKKYVGAYVAAMGGLDAVVFTGGIGENSPSMRRRICDGLDFMGLQLDLDRNQAVKLEGHNAPQIQSWGSRVKVLVTETAEQLMIARATALAIGPVKATLDQIPVAISARHVHLSREPCDALFGKGYELTISKPLRQPGQWAAEERVTLQGPKGKIERVAILGPLRSRAQIEVSRTDSFALGIDVPVRDSGKLDGTPKIILIGPAGQIETDGLIIAARHIHTNPTDAIKFGLEEGELVDVQIGEDERGLTFGKTLVRIGKDSFTEMHIDTDEANAAGIKGGTIGLVIDDDDDVKPLVKT